MGGNDLTKGTLTVDQCGGLTFSGHAWSRLRVELTGADARQIRDA